MKKWKYLFEIFVCNRWIMKHENICLQYMNYENRNILFCKHYENFSLQNMNFENMKIFVCNTWIMKILV